MNLNNSYRGEENHSCYYSTNRRQIRFDSQKELNMEVYYEYFSDLREIRSKFIKFKYDEEYNYDQHFNDIKEEDYSKYLKKLMKYFGQDVEDKSFLLSTTKCVVCEAKFETGVKVTILPCLHFIHSKNCYDFTVGETGLCPCRINAVKALEDEEE